MRSLPRRRCWRAVCAALAAGALALAPVGTAAADAPAQGEPAPPRLVKTPAREQVWLVAGGQRQWIADVATFAARGYRWEDVELMSPAALYALPLRAADHAGLLLRAPAGDVYLVADGQARLVPDLLTFEGYGLDWRRVQAVGPAALAQVRRGAPLPHVVAGRGFPEAPPAGSGAAARGAAPAEPDARLRAALDLMAAYPPTAGWPAFLRERGVAIRFGTLAGAQAAYNAAERSLTVAAELGTLDSRALATLLVHETVHALYDARGISGKTGKACIDEEASAFAIQSAFWAHQHGLGGAPQPAGSVEQELNRTLQWALDDALAGRVLTTWAYTLRCYFPDFGGRPGEE